MKLAVASLVCVVALCRAMPVSAGPMDDLDGDGVPEQFDNCWRYVNGPFQGSNQVDTDLDGYGNACDADFDNNLLVTGTDFSIFVGCFGSSSATCMKADMNGDLLVSGLDFSRFVQLFALPMNGLSGLVCAGSVPCNP